MPNFYFTFGFGSPRANKFVHIPANDWGEARDKIVKAYGTAWAFQYEEEAFLPQITRYNLSEIQLGD